MLPLEWWEHRDSIEGFHVNVRALAATAVAASLLLGTTGCGIFVESATLKPYAASDGVNIDVGELKLRNVLVITDESGDGSLIGTIVNDADMAQSVNVELRNNDGSNGILPAFPGNTILGVKDSTAVLFVGAGLEAGQYIDVYVQYGSYDGVLATVPVLDGTDPIYAPFTPAALAPTPIVTESPAPSETPLED